MAPVQGDEEEALLRQRCLYEILGVDRTASVEEIRSAYRKQALKWHPDKIQQSGASPDACHEATVRFQAIARAYEVLGDPSERAWYDSHRSAILSSASAASSSQTAAEFDFNLWQFFSTSAFSGFGDSGSGFYAVYGKVFQKLHEQETVFARAYGDGLLKDAPRLGGRHSDYSQVLAFYNYWLGFSSVKDFAWCNEYRTSAGPNRKSRRLMEEENKKIRRKAKKEFNEAVRQLAAFVKKRDKRVIERQIEMQRLQKEKELMLKLKRQELEKEKLARIQQYEEPDWARGNDEKFDSESDSDQNSYDYVRRSKGERQESSCADELNELYCIICGKKFKSDKQWQNHEKSKKHIEKAAALRDAFVEEDDQAATFIDQHDACHDSISLQEEQSLFGFSRSNAMEKDGASLSEEETYFTYGKENGEIFYDSASNLQASMVHTGEQAPQNSDDEFLEAVACDNAVENSKPVTSSDNELAEDSDDDESSMLTAMLKSHNSRVRSAPSDPVEGRVDIATNGTFQEDGRVDSEEGAVESADESTEFDLHVVGRKPPKSKSKLQKRKTAALERHVATMEEVASLGAALESTKIGEVNGAVDSADVECKAGVSQQDRKHKLETVSVPAIVEEKNETSTISKEISNRSRSNPLDLSKAAKITKVQSEVGKKGKKKKGGMKTSSNTCDTCGEDFDTRNQLFKHISSTQHYTLKSK